MKNIIFLILVLALFSCKDDDTIEVASEPPFNFYHTKGARWLFSDTFEREIGRNYPNLDDNILYTSCYGTFKYNGKFTLGEKVTLYSKSILNDIDTTEPKEFEYHEVLAVITFQIDSAFAVTPKLGDTYFALIGTRKVENGITNKPVLSGWIRFDEENKKVFSRRKIANFYFDLEVFDFGCEDGCEKIELEGKSFLKSPQRFKYAVSGISLTHFSVLNESEEYSYARLASWTEGCNFKLEFEGKVYKGPTFPF